MRVGMFFDSNLLDSSTWKAAWTGVNTLAGLSYGVAGGILGDAQAEYKDGVLQFTGHPWGDGDSAVTLGQVIIYFNNISPDGVYNLYESEDKLSLNYHERGHVLQANALGPLYIPGYLLSGGWWTSSNPFEVDANAYSRETMKALGIYYLYNRR